MRMVYGNVIFFALGVWLLQRCAALPGILAWLALAAAMVAAVIARQAAPSPARQWAAALLMLVLGFGWAALRAEFRLASELPMVLEGQDLEITGVIDSLPQDGARSTRFSLRVLDGDPRVPSRLKLSWYRSRAADAAAVPALLPGQHWRLTVRLRRPHGRLNPQGGDYAGRLLEEGVRATGYVRAHPPPRLLGHETGGWLLAERARHALRERFESALGERPWGGLLIAMTIGDQRALDSAQWDLLRRTGLVHLAVVSGLHITIVGGLGALLGAAIWRRTRLALRVPALKAGVLCGLALAWAYALISGLGVPVQRSVLMLTTVAICLLLNRLVSRGRILALALLVVVVIDPWSVIAPGFWLSFMAVAILLVVGSGLRSARVSGLRAAITVQLAINLAMIPALLIFFQQFSLVAPLANLLAVPVVSFVVLPLCLGSAVLPVDSLLLLAHAVVEMLSVPLNRLAGLELAVWRQATPPTGLLAVALAGCGWALLPRGTPGRPVGVLALLPLLLYQPPRPQAGDFRLTVLDVGQGLAVHVQTASHDMVFDSGPRWGLGDAGSSVLLPYLRGQGVTRLDALVLSHSDSDHAGGAATLLAALAVDRRVTHSGARASRIDGHGSWTSCSDGGEWRWDGVRFSWLNPPAAPGGRWPARSDNDRSCLLRVSGRGGSALLAADIGAGVEAQLVREAGPALAADLVLAPHHGSRSSSSPAFVAATGASAVVFSVGYRSRFGHPHPSVWARWSAAGARGYRTDSQGAIHADFGREGVTLATQRSRAGRYWHGR